MTTVVDDHKKLLGVFTDGDLRRALDQSMDIRNMSIEQAMSVKPTTVTQHMLAAEALSKMERKKITCVVVADEEMRVCGILHMHDLLRAGLV